MAAKLDTAEDRLAFIKTAAAITGGAPVHMDQARAQKIAAVLQDVRRPGSEASAHWTQKSAAAFADDIGRGELVDAYAAENGGRPPVDSRGWPIVNVLGRLISLDPDHDCHVTGRAPSFR